MAALVFNIKENDLSPAIQMDLLPATVDLTGATVVFSMRSQDSKAVKVNRQAAAIVTATGVPSVIYDWQTGDTDTAGVYEGEFEVTYADTTVETFPNRGFITVRVNEEVA